jgi:hypothetical protein
MAATYFEHLFAHHHEVLYTQQIQISKINKKNKSKIQIARKSKLHKIWPMQEHNNWYIWCVICWLAASMVGAESSSPASSQPTYKAQNIPSVVFTVPYDVEQISARCMWRLLIVIN